MQEVQKVEVVEQFVQGEVHDVHTLISFFVSGIYPSPHEGTQVLFFK